MRNILLLAAMTMAITANAQTTINVDDTSKFTNAIVYLNSANGVPFVMAKYAKVVEGCQGHGHCIGKIEYHGSRSQFLR
jgi:hypothetical protein